MEDEIKTWLSDIKQAIIEINDFLPIRRTSFNLKKILKLRGQSRETLKLSVKPPIGFLKNNLILK